MSDSIRVKSIKSYWEKRLDLCKEALEENKFEAYIADSQADAKKLIIEKIIPPLSPKTVSWGDSLTFLSLGVLEDLRSNKDINIIEIAGEGVSWDESIERRRQALLCDLFFTGSNAVSEDGMLINLDMIGNRVGAIAFGPKKVVITVGRNKICSDLDSAMSRVKDFSAPVNAGRFGLGTPCVKTSLCHDCDSAERICNVWTITEKSYPAGRIAVILINEDLGF